MSPQEFTLALIQNGADMRTALWYLVIVEASHVVVSLLLVLALLRRKR